MNFPTNNNKNNLSNLCNDINNNINNNNLLPKLYSRLVILLNFKFNCWDDGNNSIKLVIFWKAIAVGDVDGDGDNGDGNGNCNGNDFWAISITRMTKITTTTTIMHIDRLNKLPLMMIRFWDNNFSNIIIWRFFLMKYLK